MKIENYQYQVTVANLDRGVVPEWYLSSYECFVWCVWWML